MFEGRRHHLQGHFELLEPRLLLDEPRFRGTERPPGFLHLSARPRQRVLGDGRHGRTPDDRCYAARLEATRQVKFSGLEADDGEKTG